MSDGPETCSVEGCESAVLARGWCSRHYHQWWREWDHETGRLAPQRKGTPTNQYRGATHCKRGHPFDVYGRARTDPRPGRWCALCERERWERDKAEGRRRKRVKGRKVNPAFQRRARCPNGHPYDEENTYTRADGSRGCRICKAASDERRRIKKREKRKAER